MIAMNYIAQLNAFWSVIRGESLSSDAQLVYLYLLQRNNECGWEERFKIKTANIVADTRIQERSVQRARMELVELNLIKFYTDGSYKIVNLYDNSYGLSTDELSTSRQYSDNPPTTCRQSTAKYNADLSDCGNPPTPPYMDILNKKEKDKENISSRTRAREKIAEAIRNQVRFAYDVCLPNYPDYSELLEEFISHYVSACFENRMLTFSEKTYSADDFLAMIPELDSVILAKVMKYLNSGEIENRYYYTLSLVVDQIKNCAPSGLTLIEKMRANGIARHKGINLPYPEVKQQIKDLSEQFGNTS